MDAFTPRCKGSFGPRLRRVPFEAVADPRTAVPRTAEPGTAATPTAWTPRLGQHVAAARQRAGLTRGELAARLGVSEESVRRWEVGWTAPSPERLARLLVVLALDAAALAGLAGAGGERAAAGDAAEPPELARRLREERRARGISQAAAAEALRVAQATYAGWETGRALPERRAVPAIARFLGLAPMEAARLAAAAPRPPVAEALSPLGVLMSARRLALGLSREALAERVGVSARTVGAWERGEKVPHAVRLRPLARTLGVAVADLAAACGRDGGTAEGAARAGRLGELIERERVARGLTRDQLAAEVAVAPTTLTRWVQGRHRPGRAGLRRLAAALDLDAEVVLAAAGHATRPA